MRVICVNNVADWLPKSAEDPLDQVTEETDFPVTPGRSYLVFGVTQRLGLSWYYIIDDDQFEYPTWRPASLFEILDGSIPDSWEFGFFKFSREYQVPVLSFPEWASDYYFYERLLNDDPEALAVFARRRAEIEAFDSWQTCREDVGTMNDSQTLWREPSAAPVVSGALVLGVGSVDLDLRSSGLHHLVEHLVMRRFGSTSLDHNAMSTTDCVAFYATGTRDEVLGFVDAVVAAINSLWRHLTAREVELEQKILAVEFMGRGGGGLGPLSVRYGVDGPGHLDLPELGAYSASVDDVRAFLARWCVAENARVALSFDPGSDISIDLPRGASQSIKRRQPVLARADRGYSFTGTDGVTLSFEGREHPGDILVLEVLRAALEHELRQVSGLVNSVSVDLCATGTGQRSVVFSMGSMPDTVDTVVYTALRVVEVLQIDGPPESMLDEARRRILRDLDGPDEVMSTLLTRAVQVLRRLDPEEVAANRRAFEQMTVAEVTSRLHALVRRLVVTVPEGASLSPLATEVLEQFDLPLIDLIPTDDRPARQVRAELAEVAGLTGVDKWFRVTAWRGFPAKRFGPFRKVRLWIAGGQMALFPRQAPALRVDAHDVVVAESAEDGTVMLVTRRGGRIMVNPGHFWGARRRWRRFLASLPDDTIRQ